MINLPNTKMCHLEFQDEWLTISLYNRKKRNALSSELIVEMMGVLDLAKNEIGLFCLVAKTKSP